MSIYVEEVVAELNSLIEYGNRMLARFEAQAAAPELLADTGALESRRKRRPATSLYLDAELRAAVSPLLQIARATRASLVWPF